MRGLSLVTAMKLALPQTPSAKSDGGFLAVLANATTEQISANSATSFATNSAARQDTAFLIDIQHQAQSQSAPSTPAQGEPAAYATNAARATDAAHGSDKDVVASDAGKKAPEKRSANVQDENPVPSSAPTKSSPAIAVPLPQVAPVAIIPNIPVQRFVSQLPQDASTTQRPTAPMKQSNAVSAAIAAANREENNATISSGNQTTAKAAQPRTTIAQTLRDIPAAIATPGNAIPIKIPARQPATQSQNVSATQQPITPMRQSNAAPASVVAANRAENKVTASNGNQTASNAEPKAKIVQAPLDMPPAIANPGNATPTNIPAQHPATQPQDASTTQLPITPTMQSDTAPAPAVIVNLAPVEPVLSNGMQTAASVAQPRTTIAQAFSDTPRASTTPGDATATNIPARQPAAQSSQVAPATENLETPAKQPDNAPAAAAAGNEAPGEATVSNGTQTAHGPSQPETAIAQALIDLPTAIASPINIESAATGAAGVAQANGAAVANQAQNTAGNNQANSAATVSLVQGTGSGNQVADAAVANQMRSVTGANQAAIQATAKQSVSVNANPPNTADAATSKTAPVAAGSHDTPSHDSQNTQSGDAAQSTQPLARPVDNNPSQMQAQAIVTSAPSHETASPAPHLPGTLSDASRPTDSQDLPATHSEVGVVATTPEIRSATLVNALNGTEMRVGMQSGEFGDISIRTTMSPQLMHTQISLDHGELSQVISNHVSAAQAKLGDELGLRASIEINHSGASLQGNAGQSSQRQQNTSSGSGQTIRVANPTAVEKGIGVEMPAVLANGRQLDIRI